MQGHASGLHPLWREVQCLNDRLLYMNPFTGALSQTGFEHPPPVKGGILCDGEHYAELRMVLWLKLCLLLHRHAVVHSAWGQCVLCASAVRPTVALSKMWHAEMGLGKTVELLACISAHKFQARNVGRPKAVRQSGLAYELVRGHFNVHFACVCLA